MAAHPQTIISIGTRTLRQFVRWTPKIYTILTNTLSRSIPDDKYKKGEASCPKVSLNNTVRITSGSSVSHSLRPQLGIVGFHLFCSVSLRTHTRRIPVRRGRGWPGRRLVLPMRSRCVSYRSMLIRPHSINLNCMATSAGELYLSCSVCEQKYWAARVDANESAVMRLWRHFPLSLTEEEPTRMDAA